MNAIPRPETLIDWPALVCVAVNLSMGVESDWNQKFVLSRFPRHLHEALMAAPKEFCSFDHVIGCAALLGRVQPFWEEIREDHEALARAVADRDEEMTHSMVMRRLVVHAGSPDMDLFGRLRHHAVDAGDIGVLTWLNAAKPDSERLLRMTWAQAVDVARQWIEAEEAAQGSIRIASRDGWSWVRLHSKRSLEEEGGSLRHCVGDHEHYLREARVPVSQGGFWSLRDADDHREMTLWLSKRESGLEIVRFLGTRNRDAAATDILHLPALRDHYASIGAPIVSPSMTICDWQHYNAHRIEVDGVTLEAWDQHEHDEDGTKVTHHTREVEPLLSGSAVEFLNRMMETVRLGLVDMADLADQYIVMPDRQPRETLNIRAITAPRAPVVPGDGTIRIRARQIGVREMVEAYTSAVTVQPVEDDAPEPGPPRSPGDRNMRAHWQGLNERHQRRIR